MSSRGSDRFRELVLRALSGLQREGQEDFECEVEAVYAELRLIETGVALAHFIEHYHFNPDGLDWQVAQIALSVLLSPETYVVTPRGSKAREHLGIAPKAVDVLRHFKIMEDLWGPN